MLESGLLVLNGYLSKCQTNSSVQNAKCLSGPGVQVSEQSSSDHFLQYLRPRITAMAQGLE